MKQSKLLGGVFDSIKPPDIMDISAGLNRLITGPTPHPEEYSPAMQQTLKNVAWVPSIPEITSHIQSLPEQLLGNIFKSKQLNSGLGLLGLDQLPQQIQAMPQAMNEGLQTRNWTPQWQNVTDPIQNVQKDLQSRNWAPNWQNVPRAGEIINREMKSAAPDFMETARETTLPLNQLGNGAISNLVSPLTNRGPEKSVNAWGPSIPFYQNVPPNSQSQKLIEEVLPLFTPLAQFQLKGVRVGAFDPEGTVSGVPVAGNVKGVKPRKNKLIQTILLNGTKAEPGSPYWDQMRNTAIHELLHASVRGWGGTDRKKFLSDFESMKETDPVVYTRLKRRFDNYNIGGVGLKDLAYTRHDATTDGDDSAPEEMFAMAGELLKNDILNTPLGKYYKGILAEKAP